ncbi:MAG: agmatinase [Bacteroidales bacterium]|nr:agmatinase [Bacteroidales bacterium]
MRQYGDLPSKYTDFETAKVVIVPVPYDGTSTWQKGADQGPEALLEASANMEVYDVETDSEVHKVGIHTQEAVTENSSPEAMSAAVYERIKDLLKKKKFPIVIGGEHSVSIGAIQAVAGHFSDLTILQFDAHADMRQEYEGTKYNHACVMARAKEVAPIVQVGIRSMSVEEREDVQPDRIFYASHIHEQRTWMYELLNKLTRNVYITIDLDVLDPSIMPATGTPEPGGMLWYQIMDILKAVSEKVNIVGFDVVELRPLEGNKASNFLASKMIYTLLTYKYITGIR